MKCPLCALNYQLLQLLIYYYTTISAKYGVAPADDEEPIVPREGTPAEDGGPPDSPTERVQLQEVGATVGYGTVASSEQQTEAKETAGGVAKACTG